jgi:SAM-dependent methyltransferase
MTFDDPSRAAAGSPGADRRRFYDSTAGVYAKTWPFIWRFGFRKLHDWVAAEAAGRPRLLDAGAATGYWTQFLAEHEPREDAVALDFSLPYMVRAQDYLPDETDVTLVQADLTRSPFPTGSFDVILCSGVLDTFPEPLPAFRELRRLLSPGGRLILVLRGKGGRVTKGLDWLIRTILGAARALRSKSKEAATISDEIWNREALWPHLEDLAEQTGFGELELDVGSGLTRAAMTARGEAPS